MENENQLIQRAAQGDTSAFNDLLGAHEKQMYVVCYRMCGNYNDAQDCLQEAMLRVYRAISGFKGQSSFSTWLYRVTMNACLDELRKRKNKLSTSLDGMLDAMLRFLSNAWALGGSAIVLAVLLGWLDWLMCRRIPVKG